MPDVWTPADYHHYLRTGQAPTAAPAAAAGGGEPMAEAQLLAQVRRLAREYNFQCYHTYRSDNSEPGFPDCVFVRRKTPWCAARLLFVELKSAKGRLTQEQARWLEALREVEGVEVYVWRPAQLEAIVKILAR